MASTLKKTFIKGASRVARSIDSVSPKAGDLLRRTYYKPKSQSGDGWIEMTGKNYRIIQSQDAPDAQRIGIYLRGGCDLPAVMTMAPLAAKTLTGTCAISRDPILISGSHSNLLLQTLGDLDDVPREALDEVSEVLHLGKRYFSSDPFDPTFEVMGTKGPETFDKNVVALSIGPDFTRTLYRHREYGFFVDPGGYWLNDAIDSAIDDMEAVKWFSKNFKSAGKLTADQFSERFGRLVTEFKARTGAHVLVINLLTVDPADPIHNYRLVKNPDNARRREFSIRLAEISRAHDVDVIDVDRVLKLRGIEEQVDFAHFSETQFKPIAAEVYRILRAREIL